MRCTACGTELLAGKRFCHTCGARGALGCPACGASVGPDFRFCPDCGREIASAGVHDDAPPPADDPLERLARHIPETLARKIRSVQGTIEGERKVVTVLFCDIAGSTAIAERLDPEEYHELLERYLELSFREISRFEGVVNQIAGDGIMALFGAPVAHEDAPQRALRAALAIHRGLAQLNERELAARGLRLRARIGINTGPVVVGTVGTDLKMDYTAIGDTTNLAARLEALAEPGTTLVSEATHRLVRGFFEVRSVGPFSVKGKSEPVAAWTVLDESGAATSIAVAAARGLIPLVGREAELEQLHACFGRLAGGRPQVVAVVGEAGLGKSRLLYEFRRRLEGEAVTFFEARCSSLGVPYAPFVSALRQYFGFVPGETAASARAKLAVRLGAKADAAMRGYPALGRLLAMRADPGGEAAGEELKRETCEAMAHIVVAESRRAPAVVLMEDLHWIDDASREVLQILVSRLAHAPIMILVTHRPEERPVWRTQAAITQLVLRRLDDEEVRHVVRAVAGGPLPESLERQLVARAEGSPFCAEEMTRALAEEGYLVGNGDGVRLTRPVEDIRIPGTVQEVIAARLDRVGPQAKRVAQVAALLGRQFHGGQLAALLAEEGIDAARALAELELRGIVHRKTLLGTDEYRFGESLTQEVAYEGLLHRQRRQLHERVGLLIEAAPAELTPERSALLAHHFARSDNRPKALEALLRAAHDAQELPSYGAAVDFYQRAWELAEACLAETGDERFRRAALEATHGVSSLAVLFGRPALAEAERAARRGHELAQALGDTEALASLSYFLGVITMFAHREGFARGLELAERGVALAQQAGLKVPAMRISRGLAINYALDGRFELARRAVRWVLDELERDGDDARRSNLYIGARWVWDNVLLLADDLDAAEASARESYELARQVSNRTVTSGAANVLAQVHFLRGEHAEALRWADASLEVSEAIANVAGFPAPASIALAARVALGLPPETARYLDLIEQGFGVGGSVQTSFRFTADALLAIGDRERAERFATELRTRPANVGRLRQVYLGVAVGDVMRGLGHAAEAERSYAQAIELAEAIGARSSLAEAAIGMAQLATARGDGAEAGRHLTRAVGLARELRLGRVLARVAQIDGALAEVAAGGA